eukprot:Em0006g546a
MVEINRTSHDEYGAKCLLVSVRFLNHGRDKLYGVVQVNRFMTVTPVALYSVRSIKRSFLTSQSMNRLRV